VPVRYSSAMKRRSTPKIIVSTGATGSNDESEFHLEDKCSKKINVWGIVEVGVKVLRFLGPELTFNSFLRH
jgi:hypothetical protein